MTGLYSKILRIVLGLHILKQICSRVLRETMMTFGLGSHYHRGEETVPEESHEIIISIRQNNLDILEYLVYEISSPSSSFYGNYLTQDDIGEYVRNEEGTSIVKDWLSENNVNIISMSNYGEYIVCRDKVSKLKELFSTTFHYYHPSLIDSNNRDSVIRAESYSLPEDISPHIHSIFNLAHLPAPNILSPQMIGGVSNVAVNVTPDVLRKAYNIDDFEYGNGLSSQSVYGSQGQTFLQSDLLLFEDMFNISSGLIDQYIGSIPDNSTCLMKSSNCGEASLDVQYIKAFATTTPTSYWYDSSVDFVAWIINVSNATNPPLVNSISYASYEIYLTNAQIETFNIEAMKLSLRGITIVAAAGDDGVAGFLFRSVINQQYCGYYAMWPASSQYVTAVGGTSGGLEVNLPKDERSEEVVCSSDLGESITSGGGFSNSQSAPAFQKPFIDNYFDNLPSTPLQSAYSPYDQTMRGYPDVAFAASSYTTIVDGSIYLFSGTSAATPVVASLISMVNEYRLRNRLPSLGWLNPAIYASGGRFANDIVSGNNRCTADGDICCTIGFYATIGWDPVTGFGSIDYSKFFDYFSTLNNQSKLLANETTLLPTSNPTLKPTRQPSKSPSFAPTITSSPTLTPTIGIDTAVPTHAPIQFTSKPSISPTTTSTTSPKISANPTIYPTSNPTLITTYIPSQSPNLLHTMTPTASSTYNTTITKNPTDSSTSIRTSFMSHRDSVSTLAIILLSVGSFAITIAVIVIIYQIYGKQGATTSLYLSSPTTSPKCTSNDNGGKSTPSSKNHQTSASDRSNSITNLELINTKNSYNKV